MLCKLYLTVADSIVNCISQGYKPGLINIYVNVKHNAANDIVQATYVCQVH